jgi:hypothetical protein
MIAGTDGRPAKTVEAAAAGPGSTGISILASAAHRDGHACGRDGITESLGAGIRGALTRRVLETRTRLSNTRAARADLASIARQAVLARDSVERIVITARLGGAAICGTGVPIVHDAGRLDLPRASNGRVTVIRGARVAIITDPRPSSLANSRDTDGRSHAFVGGDGGTVGVALTGTACIRHLSLTLAELACVAQSAWVTIVAGTARGRKSTVRSRADIIRAGIVIMTCEGRPADAGAVHAEGPKGAGIAIGALRRVRSQQSHALTELHIADGLLTRIQLRRQRIACPWRRARTLESTFSRSRSPFGP